MDTNLLSDDTKLMNMRTQILNISDDVGRAIRALRNPQSLECEIIAVLAKVRYDLESLRRTTF